LKIIVAPNAMKGSLSAIEAANAMELGILSAIPDANIVKLPIADGGDGLTSTLADSLNTAWKSCLVKNAIGATIEASYLYCEEKELAIIEMASAAGLAQLDESQYDPINANTIGVGELILSALDLGVKKIVLGIGGSATTDGGTGLASALGFRFLDKNHHVLTPGGKRLADIYTIDTSSIDQRLSNIEFNVACDVTNPLTGETGAAKIYGPQKGATKEQIVFLDHGLKHFSQVLESTFKLKIDHIAGAGAAGGLGAGMMAMLNAKLSSGADLVLDLLEFEKHTSTTDLIITSEGKLDTQTQFGKAPFVLAKRASKLNIPCAVIAGQIESSNQEINKMGFSAAISLTSPTITMEQAIANASSLLTDRTKNLIITLTLLP